MKRCKWKKRFFGIQTWRLFFKCKKLNKKGAKSGK